MRWILNGLYLVLLMLLSPVILWRVFRHGRYRRGLNEKCLGRVTLPDSDRPRVWFHAVSVGEVIQLQKVVEDFRRQSGDRYTIVVSTSTDTGRDLAEKRFPGCHLVWFPLDFTWAAETALNRIRPKLIVLMELELWPNFLSACHRRRIPAAVVNARMSPRSHRRYLKIRPLLHSWLSPLSLIAAQSAAYAERMMSLGCRPECVVVTGSIKFDGVETSADNSATRHLRRLFHISDREIVLVAGSTQAPEEEFVLDAWLRLRNEHPDLRLVLVPRHRERFDEVAALVQVRGLTLLRRSELADGESDTEGQPSESRQSHVSSADAPFTSGASPNVVLLDTIGELSACWGLATIAFVGGSFGSRGGQNMIEPAAYGACILFGPNTWNFRDVVECFRESEACLQIARPEDLHDTIRRLLTDDRLRTSLGQAAQSTVLRQQGAVQRTTECLLNLLNDADIQPAPDRD